VFELTNATCSLFTCECPGDSGGSDGPSFKWFMGVGLAITGSFCTSFGMVLQKLSHTHQQEGHTSFPQFCGLICAPRWLIGFIMMSIMPLPLDIFALAFAPQSVIAPLSGMTIILVQVVAPRVLGERPTWRDWGACLVILCGTGILAVVGDQCSITYTIEDIRTLYASPIFLFVDSFMLFFIAAAFLVVYIPGCTGVVVRAFLHAYLAGALAGQQNVGFKAVSMNLEQSFSGHSECWGDWLFWLLLVAVLFTATMQVIQLNKGLALMEAVRYLPMYNSSLIVCSSLAGMIFYQEYKRMTVAGLIGYGAAVLMIVLGVMMLAKPKRTQQPELQDVIIKGESEHAEKLLDTGETDDNPCYEPTLSSTV